MNAQYSTKGEMTRSAQWGCSPRQGQGQRRWVKPGPRGVEHGAAPRRKQVQQEASHVGL